MFWYLLNLHLFAEFKFWRAADANGTFVNLKTQVRIFLLFCTYFQIVPFKFQVSHEALVCYTQYLSLNFRSHNTVLNYISGVKCFAHVMLNVPFMTASCPSFVDGCGALPGPNYIL